ncbi:M50 family metallopeptidase [Bacillus spongiae]|uniref:M50 family metallopeptidase n=1 Tax=Bacillus spongiae TaxID=2683610 RepID=A0ABU8H8Y9_9BACI
MWQVLKKIHFHPLLWLVVGISILTGYFIDLVIVLSILVVHELGHGVMAHVLSWRVKRISLLPFGGVAEMDEYGNRSMKEELFVVLAGPFQHIWMMFFGWIFFVMGWIPPYYYEAFMMYNVMILVFNLLPIWPLDGGRLVNITLHSFFPYIEANKWSILTSLGLLICLNLSVMFMFPFHFHLWVVLSFLYVSLWREWKQRKYAHMKFLLERYYGKKTKVTKLKPMKVQSEELVLTVLERFYKGYKHPVIVIEDGREAGKLDENELLFAFFADKRTMAKAKDLLYLY